MFARRHCCQIRQKRACSPEGDGNGGVGGSGDVVVVVGSSGGCWW